MSMIIYTEYPGLLRYIFSNLRYEKEFPIRDGFFLEKNISSKEYELLKRFENYVVISKSFAVEEWGRERIFEYCRDKVKSRKKNVNLGLLTNDEFEYNIKIFWITGKWLSEEIERGVFDLYRNIDGKSGRWGEYFKLKQNGAGDMYIFYALLSFVEKVFTLEESNVSAGYMGVLQSKQRVITSNFRNAIRNYSSFSKDVDFEFKLMRFILDIGGG